MFLMPSRYEPCGLNQMYSLRYGTPPIVHRTGGLADTVAPFDPPRGRPATASSSTTSPAEASRWALDLALNTFHLPILWQRMMVNGMTRDFSWEVQGREYVGLYEWLAR